MFRAAAHSAARRIDPHARALNVAARHDNDASFDGALVDTRVAKYAFVANLKVLQTGHETSDDLLKLGQKG
jgi:hypothetical protein